MHPAGRVVEFSQLALSGVTVAAIAGRFGVTERLVEQRLRLGNAAPELLDAYRADDIDLETLKAFARRRIMGAYDIEDEVRQIRIVDGMTGYIPTAMVALTIIDEKRCCNKLNAKLGHSREDWIALAAKSMRAETPEPADPTTH